MSDLADTQRRVFFVVAGDERPKGTLDDLIHAGALSADARLDVYAQMYRLRMRDALLEDTPHTAKLLGAEEFERCVADYAKQTPSTHYSLARFGHAWAKFLQARVKSLPRSDIGDLAALEWARAECFVAVDEPVLDMSAPASVPPERFVEMQLRFTAAVRLLTLEYDVLRPWAALDKEEAPTPVVWRPLYVMVWRKGLDVFHAEVTKEELHAAQVLIKGGTVEQACEAFAQLPEPAKVAFKAIASWFNEGMVTALK